MQRVGLTAILSVALVLALIVAGHAESPTFLYGKVVASDTGTPIKNQPVVIEGYRASWAAKWLPWYEWQAHSGSELRVHAVTDERGAFQVLNLPPGVYTLKATRLGGEPVLIQQFNWDGSTKEIAGKVSPEKLVPAPTGTSEK